MRVIPTSAQNEQNLGAPMMSYFHLITAFTVVSERDEEKKTL